MENIEDDSVLLIPGMDACVRGRTMKRLQRAGILQLKESWFHDLPPVSLADFRELFRRIPCPTEAHRADFVEFLTGSLPFISRLPLHPPGAPFWFFPDPSAGFVTRWDEDGTIFFEPSSLVEPRYESHFPVTDRWVEDFGVLQLDTTSGDRVAFPRRRLMSGRPYLGPVFGSQDGTGRSVPARVPDEVIAAGILDLTAQVGDLWSDEYWTIRRGIIAHRAKQGTAWASQFGGAEVQRRWTELAEDSRTRYATGKQRDEVVELIALMRDAQRQALRETIDRVLLLVFGEQKFRAPNGIASRRILFYDRGPELLYVYKVIYERLGHVVRAEERHGGSIEAAREFQPDVIVISVLRRQGGLDIAAALHADPDLARIPLVFHVSTEGEEAAVRELWPGVPYLQKPSQPQELALAIESAIEARTSAEQLSSPHALPGGERQDSPRSQ